MNIYIYFIKWLKALACCSLVLVTFMVQVFAVERQNFVLIDGINNTGLSLSAKVWRGAKLPNDKAIQSAVKSTRTLVEMKDTKQVKQAQIRTDIKTLNLKRTPALLPVEADSVEFNSIWQWGDEVLLDVVYKFPKQRIPWRSDFYCPSNESCKLLTTPKDQFFELSYFLYQQNQAKTFKKPLNTKDLSFDLVWSDPFSLPIYSKSANKLKANNLVWTLQLNRLETMLEKQKNIFVQVPENPDKVAKKASNSQLLAQTLNVLIARAMIFADEEANTPLDSNRYGYFKRSVNQKKGIQSSKRLVYKEQLINMVSSWQKVELIGSLDLKDRGFLFIQPWYKAASEKDKNKLRSGSVTVFEYAKGNKKTLELGVRTDWLGAILSNDLLLEALRVRNAA